jgi:hypothetical protein
MIATGKISLPLLNPIWTNMGNGFPRAARFMTLMKAENG